MHRFTNQPYDTRIKSMRGTLLEIFKQNRSIYTNLLIMFYEYLSELKINVKIMNQIIIIK